MAKAKKKSGAKTMKDAGRSLVWVTLSDEQKKKVRVAAAIEGVPMSRFVADSAIANAEKILEKNSENALT